MIAPANDPTRSVSATHAACARLPLVACVLLMLAGCRTDAPQNAGRSAPTAAAERGENSTERRFAELRGLAAEQAQRPGNTPDTLPDYLEPAPDADPESARRPLGETLDRLLDERDRPPDTADPPAADADRALDRVDRERALLAYASGRSALIAGETGDAIRQLERAAELDPRAPEIWRALGDARLAEGLRVSAVTAYRRAAELGLRERRPLVLAALNAIDRRQHGQAARWLAIALRRGKPDADAAIEYIAWSSLGRALLAQQRWRSGAEAMQRGLDFPERLPGPTSLGREMSELAARRGALLRDAGDAWARVGEFDKADEAYRRAADLAGSADPELRARRAALARLLGRPAESALLLFERLAERGGLMTEGDLGLIRRLSTTGPMRRATRAAVADLRALADPPGPGVERTLLRAEAALLDNNAARREALIAALTDWAPRGASAAEPLADDLIATADAEDTDAQAEVSSRAVRAQPLAAEPVARALAAHTRRPRELARSLAESGPPDAHAALLLEFGRAEDAASALPDPGEPAAEDAGITIATPMLWARAAVQSGRWELARAAIEAAGSIEDDRDRARVRARVLRTLRRPEDALAAMAPALESGPLDPYDAILGAGLALRAGRPVIAADLIDLARPLAPRTDALFERRLILAQSASARTGESPGIDGVQTVLREMRRSVPGGTLARRLAADERLQRGLLEDARRDLLDLLDRRPTDPALLDRAVELIRNASRRGGREDENTPLLERLRVIASTHPGSRAAASAFAEAALLSGQAERALAAVETFHENTGSRALDAQLELILRRRMGRIAEADAVRQRRLSGERLPPAAELERSILAVENRETTPTRTRQRLRERLPRDIALTGQERSALGRLVMLTIQRAASGRGGVADNITDAEVVALLEWSLQRGALVEPSAHEFRINTLFEADAPPADYARACAQARSGGETLLDAMVRLTLGLHINAERTEKAVDVAVALAERLGPPLGAPPERVVATAIQIVGTYGGAADGQRLIEALRARAAVPDAVGAMWSVFGIDGGEPGRTTEPAEIAYFLAAFPFSAGQDRRAATFYELALRYDPAHPWTGNDYGYMLLERGTPESLERAEALIEMAAEALPDQPNVTDSLGWLRYRQGVLETEIGEDGAVVRRGAVELLERAERLSGSEDDGLITEHLGDAYYLLGLDDQALEAWTRARRKTAVSDQQGARERLRRLTIKLADLQAGRPVEVAPSEAQRRAPVGGSRPGGDGG